MRYIHTETHKLLTEKIYLAGGCFWGVEAFFQQIPGIEETRVGYANGSSAHPTYEEVCSGHTGFAETVELTYTPQKIRLEEILLQYLRIVDPYSHNRQGNDCGTQYRTGVYYLSEEQEERCRSFFAAVDPNHDYAIEVTPLRNFYEAEPYHQNYLFTHPGGYCHINLSLAQKPLPLWEDLTQNLDKNDENALKKRIGELAYAITQESATEAPYTGLYDETFQKGLYVDIVSGEPLFLSSDKYPSGCGWPAFTRPIVTSAVEYLEDTSHGMNRIEVKSASAHSHLGHVFPDGPVEDGGLRYCINSAALRFIPYDALEEEGYGAFRLFFTE